MFLSSVGVVNWCGVALVDNPADSTMEFKKKFVEFIQSKQFKDADKLNLPFYFLRLVLLKGQKNY